MSLSGPVLPVRAPPPARPGRAAAPGRAVLLGRSVRAGQLVAVQAAGLALVAAAPSPWWWRAAAAVLLAGTVVAVAVRRHGRWLYVWLGVRRRYRRRARAARRAAPRHAPPGDPIPGIQVETFVDRAGTSFGIVRDDRGWTAVLALEPTESAAVTGPGPETVALPAMADALADRGVPLAGVQVVVRTVPAPSARIDPRTAVATSYREVAGGVPARRTVLVCLRLDPARCPGAVAARGGGQLGASRALASVAARLAAGLDASVRARALGPDEVRSAIRVGTEGQLEPATESWTGTGSPGVAQVAFRLTRWGAADPAVLVDQLSRIPATATDLSLHLSPAPAGAVDLRLVLRVAGPPAMAAWLGTAVSAAARRHGARVAPLDGEHGVALRDTLPVGGARWAGAAARSAVWRADRDWLRRLSVRLDRGGVVLGRDAGRSPVVLALFRERPSTVSAVLDPGVVLVLCSRALATGARVTVVSARADRWLPLRGLGLDDPDALTVATPETAELVEVAGRGTGPDRPHLVVLDLQDRSEPPPGTNQPWHTVLTVTSDLSAAGLRSARAAAAVMLRRVPVADAGATASVLGLAPDAGRVLTALTDEQFATVERGRLVVVNLALTGGEGRLVLAATGAARGLPAYPPEPRVRPQDRARQR